MIPDPENPCVVTILAPFREGTVWIRLIGAVEMGAGAALDVAVDRVRELRPRRVVIDCAGVEFAGSLFVYFLVSLHLADPLATIRLRNAAPIIRFLVTSSGVADLVTVDAAQAQRPTAFG